MPSPTKATRDERLRGPRGGSGSQERPTVPTPRSTPAQAPQRRVLAPMKGAHITPFFDDFVSWLSFGGRLMLYLESVLILQKVNVRFIIIWPFALWNQKRGQIKLCKMTFLFSSSKKLKTILPKKSEYFVWLLNHSKKGITETSLLLAINLANKLENALTVIHYFWLLRRLHNMGIFKWRHYFKLMYCI